MSDSHEVPTLAWFEGICVEIDRNPKKVTASILLFREQDYALEACHTWMRTPECSAIAQFQLALIMQYCSLKNWAHLSAESAQSLRDTLWTLIQNASVNNTMPMYALNKLMQVYSLLWKRGWHNMEAAAQRNIFAQIETLINSTDAKHAISTTAFTTGAQLLTTLIEEFESRSTSEIGLPLEFHNKTHENFEKMGLQDCLRLAQLCLNRSTQQMHFSAANTQVVTETIPMVTEAVKLFVEILNWTFNASTTGSQTDLTNHGQSKNDKKGSSLLNLPRSWAAVLLHPEFLACVFRAYTQIRQICVQLSEACHLAVLNTPHKVGSGLDVGHQQLRSCSTCLTELRILMISFASLSGSKFFETDIERITLGNAIFHAVEPMICSAVSMGETDGTVPAAGSPSAIKNGFLVELCSEESVSFGTIISRVLGNFKITLCMQMAAFETVLVSIGSCAFSMSKQLTIIAEDSISRLSSGKEVYAEDTLFESWQSDAVVLLMEAWCMVLDDQLLVDPTQSSTQPSIQLRAYVRTMSPQVFVQLFDCYLHTILWEALSGELNEEDEEEEEEGIDERNRDELLTAICTIGRLDLGSSLNYLSSTVSAAMADAEAILNNSENGVENVATYNLKVLRCLEMLRICFLFCTHLFVEDFRSDITSNAGLDTPTIPQLILDTAMATPHEIYNKIKTVYWQAIRILQLQQHLMSSEIPALRCHQLVSGFLTQSVLRFLREYNLRFVSPDSALYHEIYANNVLFQLPDPEFMSSVEAVLQGSLAVIRHMPLEREVVQALSQLIISFSKCNPQPHWSQVVLSIAYTGEIFKELSGSGAHGPSRLSHEGRSQVFGALAHLAIKAGNTDNIVQLCAYIYEVVQQLTTVTNKAGMQSIENKQRIDTCVSCLRGLAGTPSGMDKILRELFDRCLPVISWCLNACGEADDVVSAIVYMIRDYAENKLDALPQQSSLILYRTSLSVLELLVARLHTPLSVTTLGSQVALEEEETWRSNILLVVMQLLNHLVCKDFFLECEDDEDVATTAAATSRTNSDGSPRQAYEKTPKQEVTDILIYAFQALVPVMNESLLRAFPQTCDRYFAFVAFMFNSYSEPLGAHFAAIHPEDGTSFLKLLMQHLLWSAGAVEPTSARLALQTIQAMAAFHHQAMKTGRGAGLGIGPANAAKIFNTALDRILEMVFYPRSAEYGIAWDRVDACGSTLITLVALDAQQFLQTAHAIVAQLTSKYPTAAQALFDCFEKLTTSRGVDMHSLDRRNRQVFCANFREFCQAIRPLVQI